MSKFKVGDKIRRIDGGRVEAEVIGFLPSGVEIIQMEIAGTWVAASIAIPHNWELIPPEPTKSVSRYRYVGEGYFKGRVLWTAYDNAIRGVLVEWEIDHTGKIIGVRLV